LRRSLHKDAQAGARPGAVVVAAKEEVRNPIRKAPDPVMPLSSSFDILHSLFDILRAVAVNPQSATRSPLLYLPQRTESCAVVPIKESWHNENH
jgi:hypothetical protein